MITEGLRVFQVAGQHSTLFQVSGLNRYSGKNFLSVINIDSIFRGPQILQL